MKVQLYAAWLALRRLLRRPGAVLGFLLLPAAVAFCGVLLPQEALEEPVEVGLCRPAEQSGTADALCDLLLAEEDGYVRFREADPETARAMVAAGTWDCAFLLQDGFDARLEEGVRAVTLVRAPGSVLPSIAREAVSAALLQVHAGDLAEEYLRESSLTPETADGLDLHNDRPMSILAVGEEGRTLAALTAGPLIRALLAVLLLVEALMEGAVLRRYRRSAWYRRAVGMAGEAKLIAPRLLAGAAWAWAAAALTVIAGARFLPHTGHELAVLLLYQLALVPVTMLVSRIPAADEWLSVVIPYVAVACLLLCPALLDAGRLVPALYPASRVPPPTWYLLAADGTAWPLLCACAALWGAALLAEGLAKTKRKG